MLESVWTCRPQWSTGDHARHALDGPFGIIRRAHNGDTVFEAAR